MTPMPKETPWLIVLVFVVAALALAVASAMGQDVAAFVEGDAVGPGGIEATCDLPAELRMRNTGGMGRNGPGTGAGLCVFTSIEHAAKWSNESRLVGLQKYMTTREGGGYPEKVDRVLAAYAPGIAYIQHTGGDLAFLRAALRTGRMPSVTYAGRDPRYGSMQRIAHMVNVVYLSDTAAAVLDNNYPEKLLWMSAAEFRDRWLDMSGGWAVVTLAPAPPPVPNVRTP